MNYFPLMPGDARVPSIDVQTPKHYLRVDFVPFFFSILNIQIWTQTGLTPFPTFG